MPIGKGWKHDSLALLLANMPLDRDRPGDSYNWGSRKMVHKLTLEAPSNGLPPLRRR